MTGRESVGATFQLGGKFGVGRSGGIEKTSLISLMSEESRTRPHGGIAGQERGRHAAGQRKAAAPAGPRAVASSRLLLDDLIGAGEDRRGDGQNKRLGGLEIDD